MACCGGDCYGSSERTLNNQGHQESPNTSEVNTNTTQPIQVCLIIVLTLKIQFYTIHGCSIKFYFYYNYYRYIHTTCASIIFYSTIILCYSIRTMTCYTCTYSLLRMCCRLAAALERESRDLISMLSSSIILRGRESLCARRGADVG